MHPIPPKKRENKSNEIFVRKEIWSPIQMKRSFAEYSLHPDFKFINRRTQM